MKINIMMKTIKLSSAFLLSLILMGCNLSYGTSEYSNSDNLSIEETKLTCQEFLSLTDEEQAIALSFDSSLNRCNGNNGLENTTQGIIVDG